MCMKCYSKTFVSSNTCTRSISIEQNVLHPSEVNVGVFTFVKAVTFIYIKSLLQQIPGDWDARV